MFLDVLVDEKEEEKQEKQVVALKKIVCEEILKDLSSSLFPSFFLFISFYFLFNYVRLDLGLVEDDFKTRHEFVIEYFDIIF